METTEVLQALKDLLQNVPGMIEEYWLRALGAIALILLTSAYGRMWAWYKWQKKYNNESVIASINTRKLPIGGPLVKKSLQMITVMQKKLKDILDNPHALKIFIKATRQTTEKMPLIYLGENKIDILMPFLNEISAMVNYVSAFAKDMGLPTIEATYILAPTYERYEGMRFQATRIIVVKKEWILDPNSYKGEIDKWNLEYPHHFLRIETLRLMQEDCEEGVKESKHCMEFNVIVLDSHKK